MGAHLLCGPRHGPKWDQHLIPVDARLETDRDVQFEALALDQLLSAVEGARKLRIILLVAVR